MLNSPDIPIVNTDAIVVHSVQKGGGPILHGSLQGDDPRLELIPLRFEHNFANSYLVHRSLVVYMDNHIVLVMYYIIKAMKVIKIKWMLRR